MTQLLNTLYVTTPGSYLHLDHDTVRVEVEHETRLRVPLLHLSGIICFGHVSLSPALMSRCATEGRSVVLLDRHGRFQARIEGPLSGNVLVRRAQHEALSDASRVRAIARGCVAGKLQNCRFVLQRAAREATEASDAEALASAVSELGRALLEVKEGKSLDELRGREGEAAWRYFQVFDRMIRQARADFRMATRTRRPPRDRTNALLSFLYTLLTADCRGALEAVGLDPQVGFLHALRPGRPALALDVMEELRPIVADRLALTMINRRQLQAHDFEERAGGSVLLSDEGRRAVIVAYQEKKREEVSHRVLGQKVPIGLLAHAQARLLARHLRGELPEYPPYVAH